MINLVLNILNYRNYKDYPKKVLIFYSFLQYNFPRNLKLGSPNYKFFIIFLLNVSIHFNFKIDYN